MRKKEPQRKRLERLIRAAREEALRKNLHFSIEVDGVTINTSTLAFIKNRKAAQRWIGKCVRSNERLNDLHGEKVRQALWQFWKGE